MSAEVKVIVDSISPEGKRITTLQLKYWRAIHGEVMTHRVFSRNASSSRAIPVMKLIMQVLTDPAGPIHWGQNRPGMQATEELTGWRLGVAKGLWRTAGVVAAGFAWGMVKVGLHKQVANRILEPWQYIHVVLTSTEWENFFELRLDQDAQPEFRELAGKIKAALDQSVPAKLNHGEWHLPYVTDEDRERVKSFAQTDEEYWNTLKNISAARCCRVSYLRHDGKTPRIADDLSLCDKLVGARPLHASPFEHIATPDQLIAASRGLPAKWDAPQRHGNFIGWIQYRKLIEVDTWRST